MGLLLRISCAILIFYFGNIEYSIATINVKFEDVNIEYVNGEFVDEDSFDISVNYINDTYNTLRCKATVIKKFPEDLIVKFKPYAYALGDFRIPVGFDMDVSICDIKKKPILMAPFIRAIGGDLDKCVPDEGEYGNDSFHPVDLSVLPNIFPRNKYRLDIEICNKRMDLIKVQFYVEIL